MKVHYLLQCNSACVNIWHINFSTASKYHNHVGIWILLSLLTRQLFCCKPFVKAFWLFKLIYKDNLTTIDDHTVACIALESKDGLVWIIFSYLVYFIWSIDTIHENRLLQNFYSFEPMTPYDLFENALVILDLMQLVIKGLVSDFFTSKKFLDLIKDRHTAEDG